MRITGIHHITAIASDGQRCIDFYCNVLGLRLVKVTVNYDDPSNYHIYFGDHRATPGTLLTFFLWPGVKKDDTVKGQVESIAYAVPRGSLEYWRIRLTEHGIEHEVGGVIMLRDPDGMAIELIETEPEVFHGMEPMTAVPQQYALGPFHGATLCESDPERTATFLAETFGMERVMEQDDALRFRCANGGELKLVPCPDARQRMTAMGPGIVHHIAFRAKDDLEQQSWRERTVQAGRRVTDVRERTYFRSIYFREPGGVLFEIATDQPGMTADEPIEQLGHKIMLPKWMENNRSSITAQLPTLHAPETGEPIVSPTRAM